MGDPYLPHNTEIVDRVQEGADIFTLRLQFSDPELHNTYKFAPGQFNMLYLYGVGEVPISIVSDPEDNKLYDHTIRVVGRITEGLNQLKKGDVLGVRGPYGRGWPLAKALGKNVVVITGGLGCAPVVAMVHYMIKRRNDYREISLLQGVKHSSDLIYQDRIKRYAAHANLKLLIAADAATKGWPWYAGRALDLIAQLNITPGNTVCFLCGPEMMMITAIKLLLGRGVAETDIYLSMERSMLCGFGHCGHCQFGGKFICKDGPVFCYTDVKALLGKEGF